jgi:hypothetical protein
MQRSFFLGILGATWLSGCARQAGEQPFVDLDSASQPLRDDFNADRGKVRILMLVSPT